MPIRTVSLWTVAKLITDEEICCVNRRNSRAYRRSDRDFMMTERIRRLRADPVIEISLSQLMHRYDGLAGQGLDTDEVLEALQAAKIRIIADVHDPSLPDPTNKLWQYAQGFRSFEPDLSIVAERVGRPIAICSRS